MDTERTRERNRRDLFEIALRNATNDVERAEVWALQRENTEMAESREGWIAIAGIIALILGCIFFGGGG
jgi:hypothetical protein